MVDFKSAAVLPGKLFLVVVSARFPFKKKITFCFRASGILDMLFNWGIMSYFMLIVPLFSVTFFLFIFFAARLPFKRLPFKKKGGSGWDVVF